MRDRIRKFDSQNLPLISIELDENQVLQSNLQWLMDAIFKRRETNMVSSFQKDQLIYKIYDVLNQLNDLHSLHITQLSQLSIVMISNYGIVKQLKLSDQYSIIVFYDVIGYLFRIGLIDEDNKGEFTLSKYYYFKPLSEAIHSNEKVLLTKLGFIQLVMSVYTDLVNIFSNKQAYNDEISLRTKTLL